MSCTNVLLKTFKLALYLGINWYTICDILNRYTICLAVFQLDPIIILKKYNVFTILTFTEKIISIPKGHKKRGLCPVAALISTIHLASLYKKKHSKIRIIPREKRNFSPSLVSKGENPVNFLKGIKKKKRKLFHCLFSGSKCVWVEL